jgi:hypothetical protein
MLPGTTVDYPGRNLRDAILDLGVNVEEAQSALLSSAANHTFHESTAAGPNGHALWSAHLDASAIDRDGMLQSTIAEACDLLKLGEVRERLESVTNIFPFEDTSDTNYDKTVHSRLHVIYEKGMKNRVIAILDYFSQDILDIYHQVLAAFNRANPCDFTFDQDAGFRKLQKYTLNRVPVWSLDLSKATDRLPIQLQVEIMNLLFGTELSDVWRRLLVGSVDEPREFMTQLGHTVSYKVGAPMGAKSNFPALAFTHHVIIRNAALLAGITNFQDYGVLGDDVFIANKDVVNHYVDIMHSLGVLISPYKTIIGDPSSKDSGGEFAKRLA